MEQNINKALNFCLGGLSALGQAYQQGMDNLKNSASQFIATGERANDETAVKARKLATNVSKFLNFGQKQTYQKSGKQA